ncbi:accessory Sec system glycosyltransferase GtfA [Lactococcus lactis]|uniref:accessory Sec system glycosyltransferase GtfA n=1 Tax=Lactococcus lactis TaxID=1358 RepID=UPI00288F6DFE|nr:accessory Sec system glycosyltransferase GtfA [Lactococcus lactis]MDT2887976.1 accessory Sec system glycosyltransferase GtfA [Lactococcus lactis]MDT2930756.1 accessory Sec system glycosyltransferase GtfA [Lactococcus lactis]
MTIYNFNLGIGWASSGVEYAQAYRSNIFKKNKQNAKFVFTDFFHENLEPMTKNLGFEDKEIIWLYQYFTDIKISSTQFTLDKLESEFPKNPTSIEKSDTYVSYTWASKRVTAFFDKSVSEKVIYKTEIVINEKLVQRDYYNYVKVFSEYYKPVKNQANLYQRRFFNENGSIAYDELINGEQSLYIFKDRTIYSKENLIIYFMECLKLTQKDIVIIDRSTGIGPEIIRAKGDAKVGVVIHAEHYNEPLTTDKNILWNNYYDYQFENAQSIDFFVTATEIQKATLERQFIKYNKGLIKVYAIPVGSIDSLRMNNKRNSNTLITASRLASEKHLDWLIYATVKAREKITDLTLDIYGKGGEEQNLRNLIEELGAENYINLRGQHNLLNVYRDYTTYVSTSTSEGFGLTLMEAVGSGLGMIGFDVKYGNQTFIHPEKNGILVPYFKNQNKKNILAISEAIIAHQTQSEEKLENVKNNSYTIAQTFLTTSIQKKWLNLELEITND